MGTYVIDSARSPLGFDTAGDTVRRTLQNAKNLLTLRMGEVPYDRKRGIDPAIFSLPAVQTQGLLPREVDRVLAWEPDVKLIKTELHIDARGESIIVATVEVDE